LVFVGRIERNFAALFVCGAVFPDLADRQLDTLEKCRLGRVAVAFAVQTLNNKSGVFGINREEAT